MQGHVPHELRFVPLVGDVSTHAHVAGDVACFVGNGRNGQLFQKNGTVFALAPDLTFPEPGQAELFVHGRKEGCVVAARLQDAGVLPDRFVGAVTRQRGKRGVHRQDGAVGVSHHDAVGRGLEHTGRQAYGRIGFAQPGNVGRQGKKALDRPLVISVRHVVNQCLAHAAIGLLHRALELLGYTGQCFPNMRLVLLEQFVTQYSGHVEAQQLFRRFAKPLQISIVGKLATQVSTPIADQAGQRVCHGADEPFAPGQVG